MHASSAVLADAKVTADQSGLLRFVWLEITGKCQLDCGHCYAESGPGGTHGQMTTADWRRVIEQAAGLGVGMVQFIGGEPTLHPDLPELIEHALALDVKVEVYSNLVHVSKPLWEIFRRPGVSLATSYYSDDPAEHARIVGGASRAHQRTLANIGLARAFGIPIRAGLISFTDQQRVGPAIEQLARLGIQHTGVDHVRGVGRGAAGRDPNINALCGQCATGKLAILPTGDAYPCVFSRWPAMHAGNVLTHSLADILHGPALTTTRTHLQHHFDQRRQPTPGCQPVDGCGPNCSPACMPPNAHVTGCQPPCSPHDVCGPQDGCTPDCAPLGGCQPGECDPA